MDIFDRASEQEAKFLRQAMTVQRKQSQVQEESMNECLECGEPIPEARRIAAKGCVRCVACQQEFETCR